MPSDFNCFVGLYKWLLINLYTNIILQIFQIINGNMFPLLPQNSFHNLSSFHKKETPRAPSISVYVPRDTAPSQPPRKVPSFFNPTIYAITTARNSAPHPSRPMYRNTAAENTRQKNAMKQHSALAKASANFQTYLSVPVYHKNRGRGISVPGFAVGIQGRERAAAYFTRNWPSILSWQYWFWLVALDSSSYTRCGTPRYILDIPASKRTDSCLPD